MINSRISIGWGSKLILSEIKYSIIEDRLDAEYYHPEFLELDALLNSLETVTLSNVCHLSTLRCNPTKEPDKMFKYIEIENVDRRTGYTTFQNIWGRDAPSRARKIVRANNVIVSMVRPNRGIVGVIDQELDGCICSTGFCVLVPEKLNPYVLFCFLKTSLAKKQLVRKTTASMYPTVSEKDIITIRMPRCILEASVSERVFKFIEKAKELQRKATNRLEQAFLTVEEAGEGVVLNCS